MKVESHSSYSNVALNKRDGSSGLYTSHIINKSYKTAHFNSFAEMLHIV